jgi:transcriptional regulator CtsR
LFSVVLPFLISTSLFTFFVFWVEFQRGGGGQRRLRRLLMREREEICGIVT